MFRIKKFLSEEDVSYYRNLANREIKKMIKGYSKIAKKSSLTVADVKKAFGIPDGDMDVLLKQFREKDFIEYCRDDEWRLGFTKVLDSDGNVKEYETRTAHFRYINKWDQKGYLQEYRIIVNEKNKIVWAGFYDEKHYFISVGEEIYSIKYEHKKIYLNKNIISNDEYFDFNTDGHNTADNIIKTFFKYMGTYRFTDIENAKEVLEKDKTGVCISIDEYFEKGFFYKGLRWNISWRDYLYPNDITILANIQAKDNLFRIEIENITYPFYGYLILDLKNLKLSHRPGIQPAGKKPYYPLLSKRWFNII